MRLQENFDRISNQLRVATESAARAEDSVSLIAVTKYVDSEIVGQLVDMGITHIGENRVDKFLDKYNQLKDRAVTWHLIGSLQRRKVKDVINLVDYFHALDSLSLAHEIQKRADKPINCFLQVNISGEESKHGFKPEELDDVLPVLSRLDKLVIVGLMTMAPFEASDHDLNAIFKQTKNLKEEIREKQYANMPMTELSMGMSGDFPLAIANGATFVRIGSAFFE